MPLHILLTPTPLLFLEFWLIAIIVIPSTPVCPYLICQLSPALGIIDRFLSFPLLLGLCWLPPSHGRASLIAIQGSFDLPRPIDGSGRLFTFLATISAENLHVSNSSYRSGRGSKCIRNPIDIHVIARNGAFEVSKIATEDDKQRRKLGILPAQGDAAIMRWMNFGEFANAVALLGREKRDDHVSRPYPVIICNSMPWANKPLDVLPCLHL
jgi:hypothetical protein